MYASPPRAAEKASIVSVASYYRRGWASSAARFTWLDPAAALIAMHQQGGRLRPVTARRYFEDDRRVLAAYLRYAKRRYDIEPMTAALKAALMARGQTLDAGGLPRPPLAKRTSALKVIDATPYEARTAFFELREQALSNRNIHSILAALFVLVCNHAGLRPIELIGANLVGTVLTLVNAKARPGAPISRRLDLSRLHHDVLDAVALMIALMPDFQNRYRYELFRNRLREALQRACVSGNIRELSLYSFRHIAISTWSRSGMGSADIARLAGHSSLGTASRHYSRGGVGHDRVALAVPAADFAPEHGSRSEPNLDGPIGQPASAKAHDGNDDGFEHNDMPEPVPRDKSNHSKVSLEDLNRAKARWAGDGKEISITAQNDLSSPSQDKKKGA